VSLTYLEGHTKKRKENHYPNDDSEIVAVTTGPAQASLHILLLRWLAQASNLHKGKVKVNIAAMHRRGAYMINASQELAFHTSFFEENEGN